MFAISMLSFPFFAMIFMTVNAVYAILDEWNYCTLRNWGYYPLCFSVHYHPLGLFLV